MFFVFFPSNAAAVQRRGGGRQQRRARRTAERHARRTAERRERAGRAIEGPTTSRFSSSSVNAMWTRRPATGRTLVGSAREVQRDHLADRVVRLAVRFAVRRWS